MDYAVMLVDLAIAVLVTLAVVLIIRLRAAVESRDNELEAPPMSDPLPPEVKEGD